MWDPLHGTGASIRGRIGLPYEVPAAGKTGTTNESTDLWFNGFTPNLQATVWFGMDQPQPLYAGATSGEATPVWGEFMRLVYFGKLIDEDASVADIFDPTGEEFIAEGKSFLAVPILPIPEPWPLDGLVSLEADSKTGLLASPWCPPERRYVEYYLPGTEPVEQCDDTAPGRSILRWPW